MSIGCDREEEVDRMKDGIHFNGFHELKTPLPP